MKGVFFIFLITLCTSILSADLNKEKSELNAVITIGQESSQLLLKTLGKNMKKHMKNGGAIEALDFCSMQAYNLTELVNTKLQKGVRVKRISAQYRNPSNKPSKDELAILQSFENMKQANTPLTDKLIQETRAGLYKYYKPLVIQKKVCLKCHGTQIEAALQKEIDTRYPNDNATQYVLGDLRGAIVVEIDKRIK